MENNESRSNSINIIEKTTQRSQNPYNQPKSMNINGFPRPAPLEINENQWISTASTLGNQWKSMDFQGQHPEPWNPGVPGLNPGILGLQG